jgi:hypothetical protein
VRVDRIASRPATRAGVQGVAVSKGDRPRPYAQFTLVSASRPEVRYAVKSDAAGRFNVRLAPGNWLVYERSGGRTVLHGRVQVRPEQTSKVTLVSR